MLRQSPKYRRPLSTNQTYLLKLFYKFRYITVPLLAELLNKDRSSVYENLYVLYKQGLINKSYNNTYRLLHKPATYSLATKGIAVLRNLRDQQLSELSLRNQYKNRRMDKIYISKCLQIMETYNSIKRSYSDNLDLYTKSELAMYDYFSRPLPDIYIKTNHLKLATKKEYLLYILDALFIYKTTVRTIRRHQDHCDEIGWPEGHPYPDLLLIVPNELNQLRIIEIIEDSIQDFEIYVLSISKLNLGSNESHPIWSGAFGDTLEL